MSHVAGKEVPAGQPAFRSSMEVMEQGGSSHNYCGAGVVAGAGAGTCAGAAGVGCTAILG